MMSCWGRRATINSRAKTTTTSWKEMTATIPCWAARVMTSSLGERAMMYWRVGRVTTSSTAKAATTSYVEAPATTCYRVVMG
jgi:hypothetical protein